MSTHILGNGFLTFDWCLECCKPRQQTAGQVCYSSESTLLICLPLHDQFLERQCRRFPFRCQSVLKEGDAEMLEGRICCR